MIFLKSKDKALTLAFVSLLTFITLSTSAMAMNKILGSFGQGIDQTEQGFTKDAKNNSLLTPKGTEKAQDGSLSIPAKPTTNVTQSIPAPTQINISISPTSGSIINPNSCIVTIFGKQYDVTTLRSTHSGGDVFVCGTDMTVVYQDRHGSSVNLIEPYLVSNGGTLGIQNPTGATNGQSKKDKNKSQGWEIEDEDD